MDVVVSWFDANLISILNGVARGMLLFLMAAGLSMIFGLGDVLNLTHGGIFLFGSYVGWQFLTSGNNFFVALAAAVGAGIVLGLILNIAMRPIKGRGHLDQALVTLGGSFVMAGTISLIWGDDFKSVPAPVFLEGGVDVFGQTFPLYRASVIGFGAVVAVVLYVLVERTQFGAIVRAAVTDRQMVAALGINVSVVLMSVFLIGASLATLSGLLGAPILSVRPGVDEEVLLLALIVVVIGGLGSLKGAFVGAMLIGQVQALGIALFPNFAAFALFGIMAVVLLFRPAGLYGAVKV